MLRFQLESVIDEKCVKDAQELVMSEKYLKAIKGSDTSHLSDVEIDNLLRYLTTQKCYFNMEPYSFVLFLKGATFFYEYYTGSEMNDLPHALYDVTNELNFKAMHKNRLYSIYDKICSRNGLDPRSTVLGAGMYIYLYIYHLLPGTEKDARV